MKHWIPLILLFVIGIVQAMYAFTKYDSAPALFITGSSWFVLLIVALLIVYQKKHANKSK